MIHIVIIKNIIVICVGRAKMPSSFQIFTTNMSSTRLLWRQVNQLSFALYTIVKKGNKQGMERCVCVYKLYKWGNLDLMEKYGHQDNNASTLICWLFFTPFTGVPAAGAMSLFSWSVPLIASCALTSAIVPILRLNLF